MVGGSISKPGEAARLPIEAKMIERGGDVALADVAACVVREELAQLGGRELIEVDQVARQDSHVDGDNPLNNGLHISRAADQRLQVRQAMNLGRERDGRKTVSVST